MGMNLSPTYWYNFFWFTTAAYYIPNILNSSWPALWAILIKSHLTGGSSCRNCSLMRELDSYLKTKTKTKPSKISKYFQTVTQFFNISEEATCSQKQ